MIIGVIQLVLRSRWPGGLAKRVPESVLAGFTTGVGLKLLDSQIPEVLGFDYRVFELAQMMHRPAWLHHVSWLAAVCGLFVAFLVSSTQFKRFPAAIVGIGLITAVSAYLHWNLERVGAVHRVDPAPRSSRASPTSAGSTSPSATLPLALLAAVESLLSARAVDRMTPDVRSPTTPTSSSSARASPTSASGSSRGCPSRA
jgi:SulP family sulfate permease